MARNYERWFATLEETARREGNEAVVSCLIHAETNPYDTKTVIKVTRDYYETAYLSIAQSAIFTEDQAVRSWFEMHGYEC